MSVKKGFSLIEIVAAIVIVGGITFAGMATVAAQNDTAYRTRRRIEETALAEYKLHELGVLNRGALEILRPDQLRGRFEPAFDDYQWSATVVLESAMPDLAVITLRVYARDGYSAVVAGIFGKPPNDAQP